MKTKFSTLGGLADWKRYWAGAESWREALEPIVENRERGNPSLATFWAEPAIIAFVVELYVKAIAVRDDSTLDVRRIYNHRTHEILNDRKANIPIFQTITSDPDLMELIEEYAKQNQFRFGEYDMLIDQQERQQVIDLIYDLRADLDAKMRATP